MHYYKSNRKPLLGDDTTPKEPTTLQTVISNPTVKTASGIALTYHGYKRTGSVWGAILYGLVGRFVPAVGVPVAVAQGFGKSKGGGS